MKIGTSTLISSLIHTLIIFFPLFIIETSLDTFSHRYLYKERNEEIIRKIESRNRNEKEKRQLFVFLRDWEESPPFIARTEKIGSKDRFYEEEMKNDSEDVIENESFNSKIELARASQVKRPSNEWKAGIDLLPIRDDRFNPFEGSKIDDRGQRKNSNSGRGGPIAPRRGVEDGIQVEPEERISRAKVSKNPTKEMPEGFVPLPYFASIERDDFSRASTNAAISSNDDGEELEEIGHEQELSGIRPEQGMMNTEDNTAALSSNCPLAMRKNLAPPEDQGIPFDMDRGDHIRLNTKRSPYYEYISKVYNRIMKNLSYPKSLRFSGESGRVGIVFTLHRNGTISDIEVVRHSGRAEFDEAALDSLRRSTPFPSIPPDYNLDSLKFYNLFKFRDQDL